MALQDCDKRGSNRPQLSRPCRDRRAPTFRVATTTTPCSAKRAEKSRGEDHRVGNCVDGELVETQDPTPRPPAPLPPGEADSFSFVSPRVSQLSVALDAVMGIGHEVVEMHPSLSADGDQLEEHVHEHGLARAPTHHGGRAPGPARVPRGAWPNSQPSALDLEASRLVRISEYQTVELVRHADLQRIRIDRAAARQILVALTNGPEFDASAREAEEAVTVLALSSSPVTWRQRTSEIGWPLEVCPSNRPFEE